MVSLKQIHNFLVLAETLHFAKAALQLEISQATLSSEINQNHRLSRWYAPTPSRR